MPVAWDRLIRLVMTDGRVLRGEPIIPHEKLDLGYEDESTGLKAKVVVSSDILDKTRETKVTDEIVTMKQLLGPLAGGRY